MSTNRPRRQTKAQPKSIWGYLDLGAVARQIDADDVLPAKQPNRPVPVDTQRVAHVSPLNAVIDTAKAPEDGDDRQPLAGASPEFVDAVLPSNSEVSIDTAPLAEAAVPLPQRTRTRKLAARKPSPQSVPSSPSPDAPHAVLPPVELGDDIEALDAESRRLKRLMADKLRSENEQLRSILDRLEEMPAINLG